VKQQDDFFEPAQLGFALDGLEPVVPYVSRHSVRLELHALLDLAKSSRDRAPWDRKTHQHHQIVFPQMAKVLPPDEAEFLRRQFVLELERIELLLAA
jgi:hypothetical protein